jgi:hypothetical protein
MRVLSGVVEAGVETRVEVVKGETKGKGREGGCSEAAITPRLMQS